MEALKRIAFYGGTFDPVHIGHIRVAESLRRLFALDQVVFVPAQHAPHKHHMVVTPALYRYAMLALATQHDEHLSVSSIELDDPQHPFTVETLARLQATSGQSVRLFFVMGADSWEEITTWREWQRVLAMVEHIVVTRPGYQLSAAHVTPSVRERIVDLRGAENTVVAQELEKSGAGARIYFTDVVRLDVSSTTIRRAAQEHDAEEKLTALVTLPVANYIQKYRLYREVHEPKFFDAGTGSKKYC